MKELNNIIKWVNALESGEYKQGKNALYTTRNNGYCCLGVASLIFGLDPAKAKDIAGCYTLVKTRVSLNTDYGLLAKPRRFYNERELININDRTNAGFKRIAKLIKNHPDWLFIPPGAYHAGAVSFSSKRE